MDSPKKVKITDTVTNASFLLNKKTSNTAPPKKKVFNLPKNLDEVENILAQIQGILEQPPDLVTIDALIGGFILAFVSLHIFDDHYQGIYPLTKFSFIDKQELENLRHRLLHQCHYISDDAISSFAKQFLLFNSRITSFRDNGNLRSQDLLTFSDTQLYKELESYDKNVIRQDDVALLKRYIELVDKLNRCMKYIENAEQLKLHQPNIYIVISYIFKLNNLVKSFSKEFRNKNPELVSFLSIYRNQVAHQDYTLYDQLFEGNGNLHYEKFFSLVKNSAVILKFANKTLSTIENLRTAESNQEVKSHRHAPDPIKNSSYSPNVYYATNPYMFYTIPTCTANIPPYYGRTPLETIYFYLTSLLQSRNPIDEGNIIIAEIKKLDGETLNYFLGLESVKETISTIFSNPKQLKIEELITLIQNNHSDLTAAIYQTLYPEVSYSVEW